MVVKIVPNDKANPPGKLADAELHFTDGVLDGLKLIGFAVWERRSGSGRNVTFPARQYTVNGERRSFALLRPVADAAAQERVRDLVLQAYADTRTTRDSERLAVARSVIADALAAHPLPTLRLATVAEARQLLAVRTLP